MVHLVPLAILVQLWSAVGRQCLGLALNTQGSASSELPTPPSWKVGTHEECAHFAPSSGLLYKPALVQLAVVGGASNHCTMQRTCNWNLALRLEAAALILAASFSKQLWAGEVDAHM